METATSFDYLAVAGFLAVVVNPAFVSFLKNWIGNWPSWLKKVVSVGFAAVASFIAIGVDQGFGVVDVLDFAGFWQPFLGSLVVTLPAQLAAYAFLWKGTAVETKLANVTPLNANSEVYTAKAA